MFAFRLNAQYCPTNTVTTDPDNYQNSTDPNQLLKWDWRQQTFTGFRPGIPTPVSYQITNPFFNTNGNLNLRELAFPADKNFKPVDGWELIGKNFGTTLEGSDHPWFMLYNRYNGTIRLFLQINSSSQNFQSARLVLKPTQLPGVHTNGIFNQIGTQTIELEKINKQASFVIPNKYSNSGQGSGFNPFWLYGDIQALYDPCVCRFNSTFSIISELFEAWDIELKINGQISTKIVLQQSNNSSVVNSDKFFPGITNFLDGAINSVADFRKFLDAGIALQTNGDEFASGLDGLIGLGRRLFTQRLGPNHNIDKLLRTGLAVVTPLKNIFGTISTISSIFSKKGNSAAAPVITTTGYAESKLTATATGQLTRSGNYGSGAILTPGATANSYNNSAFLKPAYNNPLGVFNLIKKPALRYAVYRPATVLYNESVESECAYGGDCYLQPSLSLDLYQFKITEPLQYVLNPAANLRVVSISTAIVFDINKWNIPRAMGLSVPTHPAPCDYANNNGESTAWWETREEVLNNHGFNVIQGVIAQKYDGATVSTQFTPANCIEKTSFFLGSNGDLPKFSIRIDVVLEPINPPSTTTVDKIVQTYTYQYTASEILGIDPYEIKRSYDDGQFISYSYTYPYENQPVVDCYTSGYMTEAAFTYTQHGLAWPLNQTFSGVPSHLYLPFVAFEPVDKDYTSLGDVVIKAGTTFGTNPITITYSGEIINESNVVIPGNVTFVKAFPDPCGGIIPAPSDPTVFCNSQKYADLVSPLINTPIDSMPGGISGISSKEYNVVVFPNPANQFTSVNWIQPVTGDIKISLYDITGKLISSPVIKTNVLAGKYNLPFRTDALNSGVYILKAEINKKLFTKRVIVQH